LSVGLKTESSNFASGTWVQSALLGGEGTRKINPATDATSKASTALQNGLAHRQTEIDSKLVHPAERAQQLLLRQHHDPVQVFSSDPPSGESETGCGN